MISFVCDGKRMLRKTKFFGFCVQISSFFLQKFWSRYLIIDNYNYSYPRSYYPSCFRFSLLYGVLTAFNLSSRILSIVCRSEKLFIFALFS